MSNWFNQVCYIYSLYFFLFDVVYMVTHSYVRCSLVAEIWIRYVMFMSIQKTEEGTTHLSAAQGRHRR